MCTTMSRPTLKVTKDFTEDFKRIVTRFKNDAVLVGIPQSDSNRNEKDTTITNAALLAINVFGSPINNIPPRDVMSQGIRNSKVAISEQFKLAVTTVLSKGQSAIDNYYERAGILASNSVKKAINDQDWPPAPGNEGPSDSTLASRKSKHFAGTKSLVVTGQMRNSITYVVKKGDS